MMFYHIGGRKKSKPSDSLVANTIPESPLCTLEHWLN